MYITTELKNTTDKIIEAKYDGVNITFNPGQVIDMAPIFPADVMPIVMQRFQVKCGLVPCCSPEKQADPAPVPAAPAPEEKPAKLSKKKR